MFIFFLQQNYVISEPYFIVVLVCVFRDVKPSMFITELERGRKTATFLLQKVPHIIPHKEVRNMHGAHSHHLQDHQGLYHVKKVVKKEKLNWGRVSKFPLPRTRTYFYLCFCSLPFGPNYIPYEYNVLYLGRIIWPLLIIFIESDLLFKETSILYYMDFCFAE